MFVALAWLCFVCCNCVGCLVLFLVCCAVSLLSVCVAVFVLFLFCFVNVLFACCRCYVFIRLYLAVFFAVFCLFLVV